jgi:hypothetical protein
MFQSNMFSIAAHNYRVLVIPLQSISQLPLLGFLSCEGFPVL